MDSTRFHERIASAESVTIGWVDGYEVVCHKVSKDGSDKADLVAFPACGCWGVVYEIKAADINRLARIEGGSSRTDVLVRTEEMAPMEAVTYRERETYDQFLPFELVKEQSPSLMPQR